VTPHWHTHATAKWLVQHIVRHAADLLVGAAIDESGKNEVIGKNEDFPRFGFEELMYGSQLDACGEDDLNTICAHSLMSLTSTHTVATAIALVIPQILSLVADAAPLHRQMGAQSMVWLLHASIGAFKASFVTGDSSNLSSQSSLLSSHVVMGPASIIAPYLTMRCANNALWQAQTSVSQSVYDNSDHDAVNIIDACNRKRLAQIKTSISPPGISRVGKIQPFSENLIPEPRTDAYIAGVPCRWVAPMLPHMAQSGLLQVRHNVASNERMIRGIAPQSLMIVYPALYM